MTWRFFLIISSHQATCTLKGKLKHF